MVSIISRHDAVTWEMLSQKAVFLLFNPHQRILFLKLLDKFIVHSKKFSCFAANEISQLIDFLSDGACLQMTTKLDHYLRDQATIAKLYWLV